MKKQYNVIATSREAKARSKRLRESGIAGGSINISGGGDSASSGNPPDHIHSNLYSLERISIDEENYLKLRTSVLDEESGVVNTTDEKAKAGYADMAHDLDKDSPAKDRFLSSVEEDEAQGLIRFRKGLVADELAVFNNGLLVKSPLTARQLKSLISDAIIEDGDPNVLGLDLIEEGDGNPDRLSLALMEEAAPGVGASTLGELDNVDDAADAPSQTDDILVKRKGAEEWSVNTSLVGNVSRLMAKTFPFTVSLSGAGTYELGSTQSFILVWTYDRAITSQTLNSESLPIALRTKTFEGVTARTVYTLSAISDAQTYTRSVTAEFKLKKYFGASNANSLSNAEILALTSDWAARAQRATDFNCTGGKYPYYILPSSLAPGIQFWIGGLRNTDWAEEVRNVTNAVGHTESYTIYRLTSIQTGVLNIEVR